MKYLVTGGCGFIGSNYILQLMAKTDHEVVNVDCLTYAGRPENLASIENDPRYHFYKVDISEKWRLNEVFTKEMPDVVVAFAAESHVDRSIADASLFVTTNVVGTYNLLEVALQHDVERFVQIGSVVGNTPVCIRNIKSGEVSIKNIDSLCPETIQDYETLVLNEQHEVVFAPIKYHISHKADLLYRIKYTGGEVVTTGNHSVFIFDNNGKIVPKRTDKLLQNDKIVTFVGEIDCGHRTNTVDLREVMKAYDTEQLRQFLNLAHEILNSIALYKGNIWKRYSNSIIRRLISLEYIKKDGQCWNITKRAQVDLENNLFQLRWEWIKTKLHIINDTAVITPNIARAVGLYIAEGHREHTEKGIKNCTNKTTWTISETETFKIEWLQEFANIFNASISVFYRPEDHCQQISIANRVMHTFLKQFGSTAYTKCIPPFIWSLKKELVQSFMEGYEGDAHIKKTKARNYTSVNIQLLTEIAWLCRLNNIDSNVCLYSIIDNCPPYCKRPFNRQYGQLAIASNNYKKQKGLRQPWARCLPKEYILQRVSKQEGRLYDHTQSLSREAISALEQEIEIPSSIGFARITNIEVFSAPNTIVYDLSIPKNHTFFGGRVPVLLHNTDEVYGQIPPPRSSVETDLLDPRSPYSSSKASSDLFALSYYSTHKLPVIVTRSCNNLGPRQFPEKLIPLFVTNLFEHRKVPVYGDGKQIREWIHVDDHNRAIDFVIAHGKPGQIYNIGSGVGKENIEITKLLLDMMGRDNNYIQYVTDRKGHDRRYSIDCSKLMAMGWRPTHSFESGIEETLKWYLNNEKWWRPLKNV